VPDLSLVHKLQGVVGCQGSRNRDDRRGHDVFDAGLVRVLPLENHAIHQIAFAEYSDKAVIVNDSNGPDVFFMHCAYRIHHAGLSADGYKRRPRNSQETHKNTPAVF
jgi:hypothetical protein